MHRKLTTCNPSCSTVGWEKGQIEKNVQGARQRNREVAPKFARSGELNAWREQRCIELWPEIRYPEQPIFTIGELWDEEQPQLTRMPPAFDGFIEHNKRVSSTYLIPLCQDSCRPDLIQPLKF